MLFGVQAKLAYGQKVLDFGGLPYPSGLDAPAGKAGELHGHLCGWHVKPHEVVEATNKSKRAGSGLCWDGYEPIPGPSRPNDSWQGPILGNSNLY